MERQKWKEYPYREQNIQNSGQYGKENGKTMSEELQKLKDDELEQVTGGSGSVVPPGITYVPHF